MIKYKEDQFINIAYLFKKANDINLDGKKIFIGKTNNSLLVGPKISKNFCLSCFKKRILSSSFFEVKNYLIMNEEDISQVKKILVINKNQVFSNLMFEYLSGAKRQKITHAILAVPCCEH